MKLQSVNLYPKLGAYNVQFSANQDKRSLAEIEREDFEVTVPESKSLLNTITGKGFKYQDIGNGIAEYTAPYEKKLADGTISSIISAVNRDGFLNGVNIGDKDDLRNLSKKYISNEDGDYVREYLPIENGKQERKGSGVGNFGQGYDYIVNEYDETGETLLRRAYFKRVPKISKETNMAESVKYVLKRVEAYNRSEFARAITTDDSGKGVESVEFLRDDNRVGLLLFDNNKLVSFQDANAYSIGNFLYKPTTFYFENGALSEVEDKNVRYGFHIVNKETYKYDDGKFTGFDDYKLSLRGGIETTRKYEMLDNVLVCTKKETGISESY